MESQMIYHAVKRGVVEAVIALDRGSISSDQALESFEDICETLLDQHSPEKVNEVIDDIEKDIKMLNRLNRLWKAGLGGQIAMIGIVSLLKPTRITRLESLRSSMDEVIAAELDNEH